MRRVACLLPPTSRHLVNSLSAHLHLASEVARAVHESAVYAIATICDCHGRTAAAVIASDNLLCNAICRQPAAHFVLACSLYGGGMATGWSVVYGTEALPLASTKELLNAPSTFQHVDGDGVVPVASSAAGATRQLSSCQTFRLDAKSALWSQVL